MGRKRNLLIRDFFVYNKNLNASVCKICSAKFMGENVTNLKRHMLTAHFDLYNQEVEQEKKDMSSDRKKTKITVEVCQKEIEDACLEFATVQSQPLSFFDSKGFKVITKPIFDGLQMDRITSQNVIGLVESRYLEMKTHIMNVTKGHMVSIKMDTATRHNRSVLGINLQMIANKRLVVYTLSVKEIKGRQTAENLQEELRKVLEDFEINPNQVYTITTDNGRNMVKAVDLIASSNIEGDNDDDENESDFDDENILAPEMFNNTNAISIRCAAHTLQLAVKDFIEDGTKKALIDSSRRVVKTLRTPLFRNTLKINGLHKPKIDVATRWNSTYEMLESLINLRGFCSEHLQCPLKNEEWEVILDLVEALKPAYETTINLQKKQLLMGDFFKTWLTLKALLKAKISESSALLLICIEKRESQLLNNDVINSARFLDPRFRRTLSLEEKIKTKQHLKKLVCKLIKMRKHASTSDGNNTLHSNSPIELADESTNQSTSSILRESLSTLEVDSSSEDDTENEMCRDIMTAYGQIENYKPPKKDVDIDLMKYWHEQKYSIPFLKQLAYVVHAVPATQVSVERAFSALRLILDDQRCNLLDEKLASIMFVKLNQSSFE